MELPPREKLLEVATELFAQKGYAAVSIRELAQSARANSAMISYYFGGKEGLYREVLEKQFSALADAVVEATSIHDTAPERFRRFSQALLSINLGSPHWLRLYYAELCSPTSCYDAIIKKHVRRIADTGAGIIDAGITSGEFREDIKPTYASMAMAGMIHYFFLVRPLAENLNLSDPGQETDFVQQATSVFLEGLRPPRQA